MNNKFLWLSIVSGFVFINLSAQAQPTPQKRTFFFDKNGMDPSIKAGDNFFVYANGGWIKNTKIPDDQSSWGSFVTLYDSNQKNLKSILDEVANKKNASGTLEQKVGDYFASGMDTVAIEKLGYQPINAKLAQIDAIKDYKQLINFLAEDTKEGGGDLIGAYVDNDDKNSDKNLVHLSQRGTSLPEKDYYAKKDSATIKIRNQFVIYVAKLFSLTGTPAADAKKQAQEILALETEIAKSHVSRIELRNPIKNYHKINIDSLQKLSPNIDWKSVLLKMQLLTDSINVQQLNYYKELSSLLASQPISIWKNKVKFDYLSAAAPYFGKAFRDARFVFYNKTLSGQKVEQPRWKQMIAITDRGLGELLGQLYVKKYFTPDAKRRMDELVSNLRASFKIHIQKSDWMSETTKQKANEKLASFTPKIGYPDKWKNFDDVTISRNAFYQNAIIIKKHYFKEMINKLGKPVDRTEWGMTPPTVNAYYNPSNNEIVFPAGILQFPFFDANADDAVNYGAIGMVIGHEITHGYDDQGRKYDAQGNLKEWWTKDDSEKFDTKAAVVVKQFNDYTVLDTMHVKGELTLGENLADLGGLTIAYDAFKMTKQGMSNEKIDGFTPDQRFFLGYAQVWRTKVRDERLRVLVNTDPHSPAIYRVNGPVSNFEPFYKAFNVKPGEKLYRPEKERAKIW